MWTATPKGVSYVSRSLRGTTLLELATELLCSCTARVILWNCSSVAVASGISSASVNRAKTSAAASWVRSTLSFVARPTKSNNHHRDYLRAPQCDGRRLRARGSARCLAAAPITWPPAPPALRNALRTATASPSPTSAAPNDFVRYGARARAINYSRPRTWLTIESSFSAISTGSSS